MFAPDQGGLVPFPRSVVRVNRQQLVCEHWISCSLDSHHFRLTETRDVLHQSRCRLAEHHPARWGGRLHPLSHPDLLTDDGVIHDVRTYFAGNHFSRIEADPHLQRDTVAGGHLSGELLSFRLNTKRRQAGPKRMVLQRHRGTEGRHHCVADELVDGAAVALHDHHRAVEQLGHDFAQALWAHGGRDIHRPRHVGEQHGHLFVFGQWMLRLQRRSARVTETRTGPWLYPTCETPHLCTQPTHLHGQTPWSAHNRRV